MPSVTVSNELFQRLEERAAALDVSVEQLIAPVLELATKTNAQPLASALAFEDWKKGFDAWMDDVQERARRYPPEFVMDDSRESIYQGCGE
jgi:hypothetical protein